MFRLVMVETSFENMDRIVSTLNVNLCDQNQIKPNNNVWVVDQASNGVQLNLICHASSKTLPIFCKTRATTELSNRFVGVDLMSFPTIENSDSEAPKGELNI